jgi:hypothetical protein
MCVCIGVCVCVCVFRERVTIVKASLILAFQFLTATSVKMTVFWDVAPFSLVEFYFSTHRSNINITVHETPIELHKFSLDPS